MTNRCMRLAATSLVALAAIGAGPAMAASCHVTTYWRATHEAVEKQLVAQTIASEIAVALSRKLTIEQLLGALKVTTRQTSAEGERSGLVMKNSQMAYAATNQASMRNERLVAIKENYSVETGQGPNACQSVKTIGTVTAALDGHAGSISRGYAEPDVAPGRVVDSRQQAADRADPLSTDASVLLSTTASSDTKRKVIQQLAGFSLPKPTAAVTGTPAGELMLIKSRQFEAWRSPALVSLAAVQGMSDASGHSLDTSGGAVLDALNRLVDMYGGGPSYQAWTAALQGQSERGLLVELNRLRALSMRLRTFQNEGQARLAAVAAGMLAAEAQ